MGTVVANAVTQSFSMLAYALPLVFGWLADAKTGRFKLICWGVAVFGTAHVLLVGAGAKDLLASGHAKGLFFLAVYILSVGAGECSPFFPPDAAAPCELGLLIVAANPVSQQCSSRMCRLSCSTR
jgi:dipeptide/tripeptide permease